MNTIGKIKKFLFSAKRYEFISIFTLIFSILYHFSFMIVFYRLKIYPMFYFNIFSVSLFGILTIPFMKGLVKYNVVPYLLSYIEVVSHQLLADYFLGKEASFHYFIFLMGSLAFLTIHDRLRISVFMGIFSSLVFIAIESSNVFMTPVYEVSEKTIMIIRFVNIFFGVGIIFQTILIFVLLALRFEGNLQKKVSETTKEVDAQKNKVENLQNQIILSLSNLVENRDTDTGDHILRTSAYVELIARKAFEMKIYPSLILEKTSDLLKRAAPMHDVGKIVVPDSILKKPGRLTPEEFEEIKRHASEGGRIVTEIVGISDDKEYLQIAIDVATYHHERWDGTGYPCRLKKEEIPISARIMAIADVFDALVSPRCYKTSMSFEKACEIIKEESGTHFDPVLVEVFLSIKDDLKKILKTYQK